jgi:hydroxyethylthiazole kinase-like uncharacterized protein yjeF
MTTPALPALDALLQAHPLPAYGTGASRRTRGRLLAIVGSPGRPGGALLAALGALRVGCGSVRVAAPASVALAVGVAAPELTVLPLPEGPDGQLAHNALMVLEGQFASCDAIVIGPGLGSDESAAALSRRIVATAPKPLVADARALRALAPSRSGGTGPIPGPRIYTPRDREMAVMTGREPRAIEADRLGAAAEAAKARGGIVVLQDRETVIATPGGTMYAEPAASRALGTAGAGDVLAGAIGGLLAQGLSPEAAAAWGVRLHARAGALAASIVGEDGVLARDVLERLPAAQREARGGAR